MTVPHTIRLSGGFTYQACAAPEFSGRPELANPEETLLAALASCHMLTFLAIAANSKLVIDSYQDEAAAKVEKNAKGKLCVQSVLLRQRSPLAATKRLARRAESPQPESSRPLHHRNFKRERERESV